jgi:hypothetical protein
LNREDEVGPPVKLENGEDEAADADLGSEDAAADDEKPKGDGSVVGAAGLGLKPVAGTAADTKPAKLGGGVGIMADAEVVDLGRENGAAGTEGLLGGLVALCTFA